MAASCPGLPEQAVQAEQLRQVRPTARLLAGWRPSLWTRTYTGTIPRTGTAGIWRFRRPTVHCVTAPDAEAARQASRLLSRQSARSLTREQPCRLAQRWGMTSGHSVEQTEADLKALWPQQRWNGLHLRLIYFGRGPCQAKQHDPAECPVCSWAAVPPHDRCSQLAYLWSKGVLLQCLVGLGRRRC